jgi:hypothetical protein
MKNGFVPFQSPEELKIRKAMRRLGFKHNHRFSWGGFSTGGASMDYFRESPPTSINIEIDGTYHDHEDQQRHDQKRDRKLEARDVIVFRVKTAQQALRLARMIYSS